MTDPRRPAYAVRSTMRRAPLPALLAIALTLGASLAAAAEPKASAARTDPVAAEALWKEGRRLRAAGRLSEACPKFEESYCLDPALGALLNLASCHELLGRTATAWSEYREAEDLAIRTGDKKRGRFARKRATALEGRVPQLTLTIDDPPAGLVVQRDGVELGAAMLGTSIPVDPGDHEITVTAPGYAPWSKGFEAATGKKIAIEVPRLKRLPEDSALETRSAEEPDTGPRADGSGQRAAGLVLGGVGLAAIGAGAVFGVLTGSEASVADEQCPGKVCNAEGDDAVARGKTYAWTSNIAFGVGAAALVAGGVLFLTAPAATSGPAGIAGIRITPQVAPDGAGLRATAAF